MSRFCARLAYLSFLRRVTPTSIRQPRRLLGCRIRHCLARQARSGYDNSYSARDIGVMIFCSEAYSARAIEAGSANDAIGAKSTNDMRRCSHFWPHCESPSLHVLCLSGDSVGSRSKSPGTEAERLHICGANFKICFRGTCSQHLQSRSILVLAWCQCFITVSLFRSAWADQSLLVRCCRCQLESYPAGADLSRRFCPKIVTVPGLAQASSLPCSYSPSNLSGRLVSQRHTRRSTM